MNVNMIQIHFLSTLGNQFIQKFMNIQKPDLNDSMQFTVLYMLFNKNPGSNNNVNDFS